MKVCCVLFVLLLVTSSFAKPNFKPEKSELIYSENENEIFSENVEEATDEVDVKPETTESDPEEVTEVETEAVTEEVTEVDTEEETEAVTEEVTTGEDVKSETTEEELKTEAETESEEVTEVSDEPSTTEEVTVQITTVKEKDETTDEKNIGETFLRRLKEEYSKVIDPFPIPDRDFKIEQSIIVATLKFQYKLHNCQVSGLTHLYQKENFEVRDKSNRDVRVLTGKLAVDELKASCDVFIRVLPITSKSKLNGYARDLVVDVEIEHNKQTGRLRLERFQVEDINDLYFALEEGGFIKSAMNLIIRNVSRFFKGFLTTVFNIEIAYIARSIVAHITIQE